MLDSCMYLGGGVRWKCWTALYVFRFSVWMCVCVVLGENAGLCYVWGGGGGGVGGGSRCKYWTSICMLVCNPGWKLLRCAIAGQTDPLNSPDRIHGRAV